MLEHILTWASSASSRSAVSRLSDDKERAYAGITISAIFATRLASVARSTASSSVMDPIWSMAACHGPLSLRVAPSVLTPRKACFNSTRKTAEPHRTQ
jgi:hypothetical protein